MSVIFPSNTQTRPTRELIPYANNARTHSPEQVAKIAASIVEFGFTNPVLVDERGQIIAGHGRLLAAQRLRLEEVPVVVLSHLSEVQRRAYVLADNRLALDAGWDEEMLAAELAALSAQDYELGLTGFTDEELADILQDDAPEAAAQSEEVPEVQERAISRRGDLWLLGKHRLLCGDSTNQQDVELLLNGVAPSLIVADPPYFQKVEAEWDQDFDGYAGFLDFIESVFALWIPKLLDRGTSGWWCAPDFAWHIEERLRKYAAVFNHIVWSKGKGLGATVSIEEMRRWRPRSERFLLCEKSHSPDALLASFNAKTAHIAARSAYSAIIDRMMEWQREAGLTAKEIDQCLGTKGMAGHYFGRSQWALPTPEAWEKLRPLFADNGVDIGDWQTQRREFDAQRREFDAQRREFDAQRREFDAERADNYTDVWECAAPYGEERHGHPTPKPVALIAKIVSAHSRSDDYVVDPFLGSGTTLVASEQLGRTCYGMELSPQYCDVIVRRWQAMTGRCAVLERTGQTFDQIANAAAEREAAEAAS